MFDRFFKIINKCIRLIVIPILFLFPFIIWSEIRNLLIDVDYIGQLIASGEEDKFVGTIFNFFYTYLLFLVFGCHSLHKTRKY